MPKSLGKKSIFSKVEKLYLDEEKKFVSSEEWTDFSKSYRAFNRATVKVAIPFDPRFNAVHWGFAVGSICREIAFSYCWMEAYARHYKGQVATRTEPSHVDFHVSYFADNCITRIDSCRDKLSLMVWAFYCPFSPEKETRSLITKRY